MKRSSFVNSSLNNSANRIQTVNWFEMVSWIFMANLLQRTSSKESFACKSDITARAVFVLEWRKDKDMMPTLKITFDETTEELSTRH